jgi:hypothetical protein
VRAARLRVQLHSGFCPSAASRRALRQCRNEQRAPCAIAHCDGPVDRGDCRPTRRRGPPSRIWRVHHAKTVTKAHRLAYVCVRVRTCAYKCVRAGCARDSRGMRVCARSCAARASCVLARARYLFWCLHIRFSDAKPHPEAHRTGDSRSVGADVEGMPAGAAIPHQTRRQSLYPSRHGASVRGLHSNAKKARTKLHPARHGIPHGTVRRRAQLHDSVRSCTRHPTSGALSVSLRDVDEIAQSIAHAQRGVAPEPRAAMRRGSDARCGANGFGLGLGSRALTPTPTHAALRQPARSTSSSARRTGQLLRVNPAESR